MQTLLSPLTLPSPAPPGRQVRLSEARARVELREEVTREDAEAREPCLTVPCPAALLPRSTEELWALSSLTHVVHKSTHTHTFSTRAPSPQDVVELMRQTLDGQQAGGGGPEMLDFTRGGGGGRAGSQAAERRRFLEALARACQVGGLDTGIQQRYRCCLGGAIERPACKTSATPVVFAGNAPLTVRRPARTEPCVLSPSVPLRRPRGTACSKRGR